MGTSQASIFIYKDTSVAATSIDCVGCQYVSINSFFKVAHHF